jgi:diguanylate cyclase (GGDEF)-like protein
MLNSDLYARFEAKLGKKTVTIPEVKIGYGVVATSELIGRCTITASTAPDAFQRVIEQKHEANIKFLIGQANLRTSELSSVSIQDLVKILKEINDIHGHSAGDNALIMYSSVLKKCVGDQMIAVRYGGDEFLVIGPVENGVAAEEFKANFEKELKELNDTSGLPYLIEASVGYVLTDPRSKRDLDTYVEEADSLMYSVKKRNRKQRQ